MASIEEAIFKTVYKRKLDEKIKSCFFENCERVEWNTRDDENSFEVYQSSFKIIQ